MLDFMQGTRCVRDAVEKLGPALQSACDCFARDVGFLPVVDALAFVAMRKGFRRILDPSRSHDRHFFQGKFIVEVKYSVKKSNGQVRIFITVL